MGAISRAPRRPGVVEDTGMCGSSLRWNRETPRPSTGTLPIWSASGRRGAVADDARTWGVRLRHSSCEADEQGGAIRCGAGGAKGGGRGECEPAKHGPDSEPGNRVTGAGAHTARCENIAKRRHTPEVGAVCPNWARTDPVSYTHLRAHETRHDLVCRLLLEKKTTETPSEMAT